MTPTAQIPDMKLMTIAALQEYLGVEPTFDHVRRAPLAGDHGVVTQMPPEVVGEVLRPPLDFPAPQGIKAFVVHDEDAARAISIGGTESTHINALRAEMDGVGAAVARTLVHLVGLYYLDYTRLPRVGLSIYDMQA